MTPLWFMILAVLLDSGLNPVFILGLGPAPRLGIAGSATATVIANYSSLDRADRLHLRPRPAAAAARRGAALSAARSARILKTIVRKGLPMGLQMIVISSSALATDRPGQSRGRRHDRRLRRRAAALDLYPDAGDGARRRGERDGRAEYRRRQMGPGERDHPQRRALQPAHHRPARRPARHRRPAGARPVPRRRQPGAADRPPHPADRAPGASCCSA